MNKLRTWEIYNLTHSSILSCSQHSTYGAQRGLTHNSEEGIESQKMLELQVEGKNKKVENMSSRRGWRNEASPATLGSSAAQSWVWPSKQRLYELLKSTSTSIKEIIENIKVDGVDRRLGKKIKTKWVIYHCHMASQMKKKHQGIFQRCSY